MPFLYNASEYHDNAFWTPFNEPRFPRAAYDMMGEDLGMEEWAQTLLYEGFTRAMWFALDLPEDTAPPGSSRPLSPGEIEQLTNKINDIVWERQRQAEAPQFQLQIQLQRPGYLQPLYQAPLQSGIGASINMFPAPTGSFSWSSEDNPFTLPSPISDVGNNIYHPAGATTSVEYLHGVEPTADDVRTSTWVEDLTSPCDLEHHEHLSSSAANLARNSGNRSSGETTLTNATTEATSSTPRTSVDVNVHMPGAYGLPESQNEECPADEREIRIESHGQDGVAARE